MSRRALTDAFPSLQLVRGGEALVDQLAQEIRRAILGRRLRAGDRLPSTRSLAGRLAVSRSTVEIAYAQLIAEGYLDARRGSGTAVAASLPDDALLAKHVRRDAADAPGGAPRTLTKKARLYAAAASLLAPQRAVPLAVIVPTEELAPGRAWTSIAARLARTPWKHAGYASPLGYLPLREAIADHARRTRAVHCEAAQVVITGGTQQALSLCVKVLLTPADPVWVEDPCYPALAAVLKAADMRVVPVPVDSGGISVEAGIAAAPQARAAFVTPSHQYPLGMLMTMERRLALLDWAARSRAWVIEDDYDSELRYVGRPFPSLQGLERKGEGVIYMGTFSKVLFPGLRLGYLIVPGRLVDAFGGARLLADRHAPGADQATLAEFMLGGHLDAHIRRVRALFAARRLALIAAVDRHLRRHGELVPSNQGMHMVFRFHQDRDDVALAAQAKSSGLEVRALSGFFLGPKRQSGLMLGFGGFSPEAIDRAVQQIAHLVAGDTTRQREKRVKS